MAGSALDRWMGTLEAEDTTPVLVAYENRVRRGLDLLALLTIWLVVTPAGDFGGAGRPAVLVLRIILSAVYGIDAAFRAWLSGQPLRYLARHRVSVAAAVIPPLRILFSLRALRTIFRRGHLGRFLAAEALVLLNGAVIAYFAERHAHGATIRTFGQALWWVVVTVTTVGYGDFYPVTTTGRIAAALIMATGLVTLAVLTANIAASFARDDKHDGDPSPEATLCDIRERLARIEAILASRGDDDPDLVGTDPSG